MQTTQLAAEWIDWMTLQRKRLQQFLESNKDLNARNKKLFAEAFAFNIKKRDQPLEQTIYQRLQFIVQLLLSVRSFSSDSSRVEQLAKFFEKIDVTQSSVAVCKGVIEQMIGCFK